MKKAFLTLIILIAAGVFCLNYSFEKSPSSEKTYDLKYSLAKGTKFIISSSGTAEVETDQMGNIMLAEISGGGDDIFVVLSSDKEKGMTLEYEYGERSETTDSDMGSAETDFSELIGKKVKFVLSPIGKVDGFEGFDLLPEISTSSGDTMTQDNYELGAKGSFPLLPEKPVKIGDTWSDIQDIDIPTGGYMLKSKINFTYTLLEEVEKDGFDCLKISVAGVTNMSGEFEQAGTPLSIERETKSTGTLYFAYKKGMFIFNESESNAEGIITVESMDVEIPQTISSKGTTSVKFVE
jgi:hypothetical protein